MSERYDVAVVGGGAIGTSTARYLAERGAAVALFEADRLGSGSTVRSAGGVRQQFGDERKTRLAMASRDLFGAYDAAGDLDLRETGYLFLAQTPAEAEGFRADAEMQRDLGLDVSLLDPAECTDHVPRLHTDDLELGKYCPTDCTLDPGAVPRFLADRAADAGALVREDTPVTDVTTADGSVTGVVTPAGTYDCDAVVNAAGVWAPAVADFVGADLPITPDRIQLVFAEESLVPSDAPFCVDIHEATYVRPAGGATMLGGSNAEESGPADPDGYDTDYDPAFVEQVSAFAAHRLDADSLSVRDGRAGLKGLTPDGDPLVGELDAVDGFYVAAGGNGHGLILAPALGRALAGRVLGEGWGDVSLDPYDPDRFARGEYDDSSGFMGVS